jgi:4-amino-4-deoxychorismate lyase
MYPLIETIKCDNGILFNKEFHKARFEKAQKEYFNIQPKINLFELIEIPDFAKSGLFRCRVTYTWTIEKIEFFPHQFREIKSLKLVEDNFIDYGYKFANREKLTTLFDKKGSCDDILIVKNSSITDSFTANPVFFDGKKWWTPDTPLLPGTMRARLLNEKRIFECRITPENLNKYEKAGLINAMQDLENMPVILSQNIRF